MAKKEKFKAIYDSMAKKRQELHDECIKYLKRVVAEMGGSVDIDLERETLCVTYDGGRHPEYDANPFSNVESVYIKDNNIYLNTEDTTDYNICNITLDELVDVCLHIQNFEYPTFDEERERFVYEVETTYLSGLVRVEHICAINEEEMWKIYDSRHKKKNIKDSVITDCTPQ